MIYAKSQIIYFLCLQEYSPAYSAGRQADL
jgi:hypothetical protein